MATPVWKGTLSFGLVSVPVRLFGANERHGTRFHQFQRGTSDRIRYRRVNERTGKEVDPAEIVKGAKVEDDDEYVVLEPEELESITPGRSRTLEISAFVPAGSVEPLWYDSTYYLAPEAKASAKPYKLLCAALERTGRLGVATLVMRERQHLAVIGPQNGVLTLSTLWWADEVRDPEETLPVIPEADLADRELDLAGQLIEAMADDWHPEDYSDDYQRRLEELIEAKHDGRRLRYSDEGPPRQRTNVVELTEALRASLGGKGGKGGRTKGRATPEDRPADGRETGRRTGGGRRGGGRSTGGGRRGGTAGGERATKAPAQGTAPAAETAGLSKKELTRLAADLDVPGRSKMSRADLEKAVADRRSTRSAS
ncbi:non-homologous end joining protein Ku [Nocardiopsis trehalosi]|jgi:DNA end-binding protein Ku|uniref:non-homologous end joining protein Ku n=1 Tax=Nocardiopsis trehalosi TaxID=109329 RepID=UPI000829DC3F|nr:Ku protein [Nocardiopsis trehalosi]